MSDAFYDKMAALAARLIDKYGQKIILDRPAPKKTDLVTGFEIPSSTPSVSGKLETLGLVNNYDDKLIDGSRIQAKDRLLILANIVVPEMTDKVEIGSAKWSIVDIQRKQPANVPLIYLVQIRR